MNDLEEKILATQSQDFYGKDYFDKPKDVYTASGYNCYSPHDSGIQIAARVILQYFAPGRVLDVGCAKGFLGDKLRRNGIDAWGVDFSRYAIETALESVKEFVRVGNILDLRFEDNSFDLVICLETLEHLAPTQVDKAVSELCRVTSDRIFLTIPSLGYNEFGPPHGGPWGKVKPLVLARYENNPDFDGPVPIEDLLTDKEGLPLQGHLTIASFKWWTAKFAGHGFSRRGDIEKLINNDESLVGTSMWNVYVFQKPHPGSGKECPRSKQLFILHTIGNVVADSATEGGYAVYVSPTGHAGYPLYGPYTCLPEGQYEVIFRLRLSQNDWMHSVRRWLALGNLEVAELDVCSRSGTKIHARRIIRKSDLTSPYSYQPFTLTFQSNGDKDFEFRVYSFGREAFYVDPYPTCTSLGP